MKKIIITLILICVELFASEKVFVQNFKSIAIDSAKCATLTNLFATKFKTHSTGYDIITYEDVVSMIELEQAKELFDCNDENCYTQIAGALNAQLMVRGDIEKFGRTYVINLSLIDIVKSKTIEMVSQDSKSIEGLIDLFPYLAKSLSQQKVNDRFKVEQEQKIKVGKKHHVVNFETVPKGAVVLIDGEMVTDSTPTQKALLEGTYTIKIMSNLYHSYEGVFTVSKNGQLFKKVLQPAFGYITLDKGALGVSVKVDGAVIGQTPIRKYKLKEGTHNIELGDECFLNAEGIVTVTSGEHKIVDLVPKKRTTLLSVSAKDSVTGADLIIDVKRGDETLGQTPLKKVVSLCGDSEFTVGGNGYGVKSIKKILQQAGENKISVALNNYYSQYLTAGNKANDSGEKKKALCFYEKALTYAVTTKDSINALGGLVQVNIDLGNSDVALKLAKELQMVSPENKWVKRKIHNLSILGFIEDLFRPLIKDINNKAYHDSIFIELENGLTDSIINELQNQGCIPYSKTIGYDYESFYLVKNDKIEIFGGELVAVQRSYGYKSWDRRHERRIGCCPAEGITFWISKIDQEWKRNDKITGKASKTDWWILSHIEKSKFPLTKVEIHRYDGY